MQKKRGGSKKEFLVTLQLDLETNLYKWPEQDTADNKAMGTKRAVRTKKKESMVQNNLSYGMSAAVASSDAGTDSIRNSNVNIKGPKIRLNPDDISHKDESIIQVDSSMGPTLYPKPVDPVTGVPNALEQMHMEQIPKIQEIEKQYQKESMIIPSCAQWFDFNTIHEIEMQTLPEFFCGQFPHKNPETYLNYRDYIIKMYRENPNAYLSATECRKKLPGDICSIIRLHTFLEHWGLINFNVEPYLRPAKIQLGESGNISAHVIEAASKGYINVAEAKRIQSVFNKKMKNIEGEVSESQGPQNNLYMIACQKIKAISSSYAPICNFCGNICDNKQWFRKTHPAGSLEKMADSGQSIHQVLKKVTQCYILCKECFDLKNFPKIMKDSDFEKSSIQSMLMTEDFKQFLKAQNSGTAELLEEGEQPQNVWVEEEVDMLIDAICEHQNDWQVISNQVFGQSKTPEQCIMKFLELPITENMISKIQRKPTQNAENQKAKSELTKQCYPSVLMDTSNPLMSQVAIFARCLEEREAIVEEKLQIKNQETFDANGGVGAGSISMRRSAATTIVNPPSVTQGVNLPPLEKRTTRRMMRQKQEKPKVQEGEQEATVVEEPEAPKVNEEQLYLIEPSKRSTPAIPDAVLDKISDKAIKRSRKLAKRARKQIEKEMNKIVFEQLQKVELKFDHMRNFWKLFDYEKADLLTVREECLAERVALSALKSGQYAKESQIEKALWQNKFASAQTLLEKTQK